LWRSRRMPESGAPQRLHMDEEGLRARRCRGR
jgi:hypothetical protein